ncbi:hypothetical protein C8R44DRAFT_885088 [Mycena epipterygia]|nr:hypothetical protein C8R44DRAFT_885088 [Mycena epipterygia]
MSECPGNPGISPVLLQPIQSFSLDATVGALEIGTLVAIYLFGLVTGQVYAYFHRYSNDPWGLKVLVGIVWSLDLGHTVAISNCLYTVTVTQYGRPDLIDILPRSLDVSIIISGVIGPLEQGWFAWRLWKFSKTVPLPLICFTLSVLRLAGSLGLSTIALRGFPLPEFEARAGWLIIAILTVGVSVDVMLTFTLCYYLRYWRHGGFSRFASQITTWTIETGSITLFGGLSLLITFFALKNTFVWIGCFVLISKLFSNSLLLSLNSRARFSRIVEEIMSANARASSPPAGDLPFTSPPPPADEYPVHWLQQINHPPSLHALDDIVEEQASSGAGTLVPPTPTTPAPFGSPRSGFSSAASEKKLKGARTRKDSEQIFGVAPQLTRMRTDSEQTAVV